MSCSHGVGAFPFPPGQAELGLAALLAHVPQVGMALCQSSPLQCGHVASWMFPVPQEAEPAYGVACL
jgi:hypothetical protein